ncbi:MAG: VacJ family lipoprotein [Gammaproteobacteria bacterium]|nr:VacJ family lipoprotein [Gammaproteobacteria bacterium]
MGKRINDSSLRNTLAWLIVGLQCALFAPLAAADEHEKNIDPLEPVNRIIYGFNDGLDRFILRPVGKGYNAVLPKPVRKGVGNFFDNWTYPITIVNGYLQGKFRQGTEDLGRFAVNSTVGLLGLFDVATGLGLEQNKEDFGLTFARWGIGQGPYVVLPLLGPATARSGIGLIGDTAINPVAQLNDSSVRDKLLILWFIESRAALIGPDEVVQEAYDPYLFMRDAYLQNRAFLRGEATTDDEFFDEEFDDF